MPGLSFSPEALKRIRQQRGLSQPQFSRHSGTPLKTVRSWEQGRRVPSLDNIGRMADALGVDYTALITRADDEAVSL